MMGLQIQYDSLTNVGYNGEWNDLLSAQSTIDGVSPNNVYQELEKQVTSRYIDVCLSSNYTLAEGDSLLLDSIGRLCALEFGTSVYRARTILSRYNNVDYRQLEDCLGVGNFPASSPSRKGEGTEISVYPNPARAEVIVKWQNMDLKEVRMYNNVGIVER